LKATGELFSKNKTMFLFDLGDDVTNDVENQVENLKPRIVGIKPEVG